MTKKDSETKKEYSNTHSDTNKKNFIDKTLNKMFFGLPESISKAQEGFKIAYEKAEKKSKAKSKAFSESLKDPRKTERLSERIEKLDKGY